MDQHARNQRKKNVLYKAIQQKKTLTKQNTSLSKVKLRERSSATSGFFSVFLHHSGAVAGHLKVAAPPQPELFFFAFFRTKFGVL